MFPFEAQKPPMQSSGVGSSCMQLCLVLCSHLGLIHQLHAGKASCLGASSRPTTCFGASWVVTVLPRYYVSYLYFALLVYSIHPVTLEPSSGTNWGCKARELLVAAIWRLLVHCFDNWATHMFLAGIQSMLLSNFVGLVRPWDFQP